MTARIELLLVGVLAALSLVAALGFLKFWKKSRDPLFIAFAASFFIRSLNVASRATMAHPNEATLLSYVVGLLSSLLIIVAIVRKNLGGK